MAFEGNWQMQVDSPMGTRPASLSITETTGSLEGSLTTGMGTGSVSGRATGGDVEFNATVSGPMGPINLAFAGTVDGDQASGQVQFGSYGQRKLERLASGGRRAGGRGEPRRNGDRAGPLPSQPGRLEGNRAPCRGHRG